MSEPSGLGESVGDSNEAIQDSQISLKQELRILELKVELAHKAKAEFLTNMSHEFLTPLTSILGFAELLKDQALSPKKTSEAAELILQNGNQLFTLINDILDYSRLAAGQLDVEAIPVAPAKIFAQVLELEREKARHKGLEFKVSASGQIPDMLFTDPLRVQQTLTKILDNAIKFTHSGSVSLSCQVCAKTEIMTFKICDTGLGMSEDQLATVFDAFSQCDESSTRSFGGTGLGLHIAKEVANLLGGDLAASSIPGKGSCIEFSISTGSLDSCSWQEADQLQFGITDKCDA